jgi:ABC-type polysaccharide/polyol phosphate export permease
MIAILAQYLPSNNRLERIWKIAQVDFQGRYYNDRLGLLWALIKPVFEAMLYFVAFKYLLGVETKDFGVFLFGGIITWSAFSEGSTGSIGLLKAKSYLIENVQFNHIDLYFSYVSSVFFGFFFNMSAFAIVCLLFGHSLHWTLLYLPVVLITLYIMIMAISFVLSTLQPFVKDIKHLWDMIILTGFWVSAVIFQPDLIFEKAPWFAEVNPFIGILINVRGIFIDSYDISIYWLIHNLIYAIVAWIIGYMVFKKWSGMALEKF